MAKDHRSKIERLTFSGNDALELVRTSDLHDKTLNLVRWALWPRLIEDANGDMDKLNVFSEVNTQCRLAIGGSFNTDPAPSKEVKEAFSRLFAIAGLRPEVRVELLEELPLSWASESFEQLAIKSGVRFSLHYPE